MGPFFTSLYSYIRIHDHHCFGVSMKRRTILSMFMCMSTLPLSPVKISVERVFNKMHYKAGSDVPAQEILGIDVDASIEKACQYFASLIQNSPIRKGKKTPRAEKVFKNYVQALVEFTQCDLGLFDIFYEAICAYKGYATTSQAPDINHAQELETYVLQCITGNTTVEQPSHQNTSSSSRVTISRNMVIHNKLYYAGSRIPAHKVLRMDMHASIEKACQRFASLIQRCNIPKDMKTLRAEKFLKDYIHALVKFTQCDPDLFDILHEAVCSYKNYPTSFHTPDINHSKELETYALHCITNNAAPESSSLQNTSSPLVKILTVMEIDKKRYMAGSEVPAHKVLRMDEHASHEEACHSFAWLICYSPFPKITKSPKAERIFKNYVQALVAFTQCDSGLFDTLYDAVSSFKGYATSSQVPYMNTAKELETYVMQCITNNAAPPQPHLEGMSPYSLVKISADMIFNHKRYEAGNEIPVHVILNMDVDASLEDACQRFVSLIQHYPSTKGTRPAMAFKNYVQALVTFTQHDSGLFDTLYDAVCSYKGYATSSQVPDIDNARELERYVFQCIANNTTVEPSSLQNTSSSFILPFLADDVITDAILPDIMLELDAVEEEILLPGEKRKRLP